MKRLLLSLGVILLLVNHTPRVFAQDDAEGSSDLPYLSRLPGFYIVEFDDRDFDAYKMYDGKKLLALEGKVLRRHYIIKEGARKVSELQIRRNYAAAIQKAGGTILFDGQFEGYDDSRANGPLVTGRFVKGKNEIWFEVWPWSGDDYWIIAVERGVMKQEVSASDMLERLNADGYIALYINFDTGKAILKEESQPVIDEIVKLLKETPDLKLSVEGHTDNVGDAKANKVLSEDRAKAVLGALTKAGIGAGRLSAKGFGQEKPIADNRSEEGRAKNRRVELVKQ